MARIRSIKPEIFQSSEVMDCSMAVRVLFIGCITQADDEGRGVADARKFKGCVFPGDDEITVEIIRGMFQELSTNRLIALYKDKNQQLVYQLLSWKKHQRVDKPNKSTIDPPSDPRSFLDQSKNDRGTLPFLSAGIDGSMDREDRSGSDRSGSIEASKNGRDQSEIDRMAEWGEWRSRFPAGTYPDSRWLPAERAYWKLRDAGITPETLLQSAVDYCAQQAAERNVGTRFITHPHTFLENGDWKGPFPITPTKAEAKQKANVTAAEQWLRESSK